MSMLTTKSKASLIQGFVGLCYLGVLMLLTVWALFQTYAGYTRYKANGALSVFEIVSVAWPWIACLGLFMAGVAGVAYFVWAGKVKPRAVMGELIAAPLELAVPESARPILDAMSVLGESSAFGEMLSNMVTVYRRGIESATITVNCPDDANPDTLDTITFQFSRKRGQEREA